MKCYCAAFNNRLCCTLLRLEFHKNFTKKNKGLQVATMLRAARIGCLDEKLKNLSS